MLDTRSLGYQWAERRDDPVTRKGTQDWYLHAGAADRQIISKRTAMVFVSCVEAANDATGELLLSDALKYLQMHWTVTNPIARVTDRLPELQRKGRMSYTQPATADQLPTDVTIARNDWYEDRAYLYVLLNYELTTGARYARPASFSQTGMLQWPSVHE